MPNYTKEERLLIKLAETKGPVSYLVLSHLAGVGERSCRSICKGLLRTNFLKKVDEETVLITEQGRKLVEELSGP